MVGIGRHCYKCISYAAENRPGDLQEFFDSTEGIILLLKSLTAFFTALIIFQENSILQKLKIGLMN